MSTGSLLLWSLCQVQKEWKKHREQGEKPRGPDVVATCRQEEGRKWLLFFQDTNGLLFKVYKSFSSSSPSVSFLTLPKEGNCKALAVWNGIIVACGQILITFLSVSTKCGPRHINRRFHQPWVSVWFEIWMSTHLRCQGRPRRLLEG